MSSNKSVDLANSSTMDVDSQVLIAGHLYPVHSARSKAELNEQDTVLKRNGSTIVQRHNTSIHEACLATPVHEARLATPVHETGFATPLSKRNIFSSLSHPVQPIVDSPIDIGAVWNNIAPFIPKHMVPEQLPFSTVTSASGLNRASQPLSPKGCRTEKYIDDSPKYSWTLENKLGSLLNESKSTANHSFGTPTLLLPKTKPNGQQMAGHLSTPHKEYSSPTPSSSTPKPVKRTHPTVAIRGVDKTVFTPPSRPVSVINACYSQRTAPSSNPRTTPAPHLRRTPSSPTTTDCSSPSFSDLSRGRAWSQFSHQSGEFSPATTPPQSPIIAESPSASLDVTLEQKETQKYVEDRFGDDNMIAAGPPKDVAKSPVAKPRQKAATKRHVEEPKNKPTKAPERKHETKPNTPPKVPIAVRAIPSPISHLSISQQTGSSHGTKKRLASAESFPVPEPKRQAVVRDVPPRVTIVRKKALPPSTLVRWTNTLLSSEELIVSHERPGPGEIPRLVTFIKQLEANIDAIDAKWVLKKERTRFVANEAYSMNKLELLEFIVDGYKPHDPEGKLPSAARKVVARWRGLVAK